MIFGGSSTATDAALEVDALVTNYKNCGFGSQPPMTRA